MEKFKRFITASILLLVFAAAMITGLLLYPRGHSALADTVPDVVFQDGSLTDNSDFIIEQTAEGYTVNGLTDAAVQTINGNGYSSYGIVLPSGVTAIGEGAFKYGKEDADIADCALISLVIPESVTEIGESAFEGTGLTEVEIPNGVITIDDSAFESCANLENIRLGNKLETIGARAFASTSIKGLVIPANVKTIGEYAFSACTDLATLTFEEGTQPLSIMDYAFENDVLIAPVLYLPERVALISNGAFMLCTELEYVYIPSGVEFGGEISDGSSNYEYFSTNSTLIFKSRDDYNAALKTNLSVHRAQMHHLIDVTFDFNGDVEKDPVSYVKLSGHPFTYEQQDDGTWAADSEEVVLPVQSGYSNTVWYLDMGCEERLTNIDDSLYDGARAVTFYAAFFAPQPVTDMSEEAFWRISSKNLTYASGVSYDLSSALASVVNLTAPYGGVSDELTLDQLTVKSVYYNNNIYTRPISAAGTYTLYINIKNPAVNGEWAQDVAVDVTIGKQVIDIGNSSLFNWQVSWLVSDVSVFSALSGGTIYEYKYTYNGQEQFYYSTYVLSGSPNSDWVWVGLNATYSSLTDSIVFYSGNEYTVSYLATDTTLEGVAYEVTYNGQRTATDAGKYTVSVMISPLRNYALELITQNSSISIDAEGNAMLVKDWYIVNNDKSLLDYEKSIAAKTEVEYVMQSWTFGDEIQEIPMPYLQHGETNYSFSLTKDGKLITPVGQYIESKYWNYYINMYMPAGTYAIEISANAYSAGAHKDWWNGEWHDGVSSGDVLYEFAAFKTTLMFTVSEGTLQLLDDPNDSFIGGAAAEVNIADIGEEQGYRAFFAYIVGEGSGYIHGYYGRNTTFALSYADVAGSNTYWAQEDILNRYYDVDAEFVFNLARMYSNDYRSWQEEGYWNNYLNTTGDFRVYFMARMKNYATTPELGIERYDYYYTISVYRQVDAPTLDRTDYIYTGATITANYTPASERDVLIYYVADKSNTGLEAGSYYVKFVLDDTKHHKWNIAGLTETIYRGNTYYVGRTEEGAVSLVIDANLGYAYLPYGIARATVDVPTISDVRYTGEAVMPDILVVTDFYGQPIYEVEYFTDDEENYIDVNSYVVRLILFDSKNYVWANGDEETTLVAFNIIEAMNGWLNEVRIESWVWGSFDRTSNRFNANPKDGTVSYYITDADGNYLEGLGTHENGLIIDADGMTSQDAEERLKGLSAGTYVFWYWVEATTNYEAIPLGSYQFSVLQAENDWVEVPNIIRWIWGSYDPLVNVISATSHFGEEITFTISKDGEPVEGLESFTDFLNVVIYLETLPAGTYTLTAVVAGDADGNYNELTDSATFRVLQATNDWLTTPTIVPWAYGTFNPVTNFFSSQPRYGEVVTYTVYLNDEVAHEDLEAFTDIADQAVEEALRGLKAGNYILKAVVEGTSDYETLETDVPFTVLHGSNTWVVIPNVIRWSWGSYDKNYNFITAKAQFGTVQFSIYDSNMTLMTIDMVNNTTTFTLEDGIVDDVVAEFLAALPAGEYYLRGFVEESDEYEALMLDVPFSVMQAQNGWSVLPYVLHWSVGSAVSIDNIMAESYYGNIEDVRFTVLMLTENDFVEVEGLVNFSICDPLTMDAINAKLSELQEGSYILEVHLDGTNDYSDLDASVNFTVSLPSGNYWEEVPYILRWVYGYYDRETNLISAKPAYGDEVFFSVLDANGHTIYEGLLSFTVQNGVVNERVAELLASLGAGDYLLRVSAPEGNGYDAISMDVKFVIMKTTNQWLQRPAVLSWMYGAYEESVNIVLARTYFNDEVSYWVYRDSNRVQAVEGLDGFTDLTDDVIEALKNLPVGNYILRAYVLPSDNYTELETTVAFRVSLVTNTWETSLNLIRWTWGSYNPEVNVITAKAVYGDVQFTIYLSDGETVAVPTFTVVDENVQNLLGNLPAGEYILRATVEEGEYYTGHSAELTFNIARAQNYWKETPNISRWMETVEAPNLPTGVATYGNDTVQFTIYKLKTDASGNFVRDADGNYEYDGIFYSTVDEINVLASAEAGWYLLVSMVEETSDYSSLYSELRFRIFSGDDSSFDAVCSQAVRTLEVYADLKGVSLENYSHYLIMIQSAKNMEEINNLLEEAMGAIDAEVEKSEVTTLAEAKQNALEELTAYEKEYGITLLSTLRDAITNATNMQDLNNYYADAKTYLEDQARSIAINTAGNRIAELEKQYGIDCTDELKAACKDGSASAEEIYAALEKAEFYLEAEYHSLVSAKETAIQILKAYLDGKGVKYEESMAAAINRATSVEMVQLALETAIGNAPAGNGGTVAALTACTVIFCLLFIGCLVGVIFLLIKRKRR